MHFQGKLVRLVVVVLVIGILAGCGGAAERKAKYMERGKSYFAEQNYDKAAVEFKNVLQIDPKTAAPYYYLGRMAEAGQEWRKAYGDYSKAVKLGIDLPDAHIRLGRIYVLSGELDKAAEQAEVVLSTDPKNADALTLKASVLARQDKLEDATGILKGVLAAGPGEEAAAILLAAIYDKQGMADAATAVLVKASAANPKSAALRLALVKGYLARKEDDKAEKELTRLVSDFPLEMSYQVSLASFYAQHDQDDKAEAVLRKMVAGAPDDITRYKALINFYRSKKGIERAISELGTMIARQPDMTELVFMQAALYMEAKQNDKAEALLQGLVKKYDVEPEGLRARVAIAGMRARAGKTDAAMKQLDEVLAENARDKDALMLKGRLQLQEKHYTDAVSTFRSVLKDQPDLAEALILLAAAHEGNGEKALAKENLARAVEAAPADIKARLAFAQLLAADGSLDDAMEQADAALKIDAASPVALRMKAELLSRKGDMAALEDVLTRLEKAAPASGMGAFGKGRLYRSQKKYPEAIAAFDEALKLEPHSVIILSELIKTYLASGDTATAEARLRTVLKEDPDNRAVHYLLGSVLAARKDYAGAEAEFQKQLKINAQSSSIYQVIAKVRASQGDMKGVEAILRQGLDALPDNSDLLWSLAGFYAGQGDLARAGDIYQQGVDSGNDTERFEFGMAAVAEKQHRYADAIAIYEKIIAGSPKNLIAVNNLAVLLSRHGNDAKSRDRALELALKLADSKQPALQDTLGWIYYERGEYDKAAQVLADVVANAPDVGVFNYHLGMTYYKQGDKRAAREYLSKAVAGKSTFEGIDEARQTLARIGKQ
jgi:tetratricopeptide (TPR) repeat protein